MFILILKDLEDEKRCRKSSRERRKVVRQLSPLDKYRRRVVKSLAEMQGTISANLYCSCKPRAEAIRHWRFYLPI
jgi:hypothetical protein